MTADDATDLPPLPVPPEHPRRLIYLGTPAMAVPPLVALHAAGYEIPLVVSRPDKRRGRGGALTPSPVKAAALERGLTVTDNIEDILDIPADLGVVVAYGRIIKRPILERLPMINLHFSLLPRWRGAAPVERAILAGDVLTGVDVMAVEEGLDTGGVFAESVLAIGLDETAEELRNRLVAEGSQLLLKTLSKGIGAPMDQEGDATYAAKIDPAELEIDWGRSAVEIHRLVRLGHAWTTFRGKRLKVLRTAHVPTEAVHSGAAGSLNGTFVLAGDAGLELIEVQPEGKARQRADQWVNGARPEAGERLGA